MARGSRRIADAYKAVSEDIFKFAAAMGFEPTNQQAALLQAVQDAQYGRGSNWIACKSGQGPGKTTVSTIIGLWRCLWDVGALTVVTAPTMRQCSDVWLAEARRRIQNAEPWLQRLFEVTATKIKIAGLPDWGVKTVTATRPENAQGYHEQNMTVICEEASGIPRDIIEQFKGTLSNPNALFIQIGNPNLRDCAFFDCFYGPNHERWRKITFNAEDTARDYPHIVNPQRNRDLEAEFGRNSDVYRVRVLGEFPLSDPRSIISGEMVERAYAKDLYRASVTSRPDEYGGGLARQFGIDVARFGGDESVVIRRQGYAVMEMAKFVREDPSKAVYEAFAMQQRAGWTNSQSMYVMDAGGMGQGLMHRLYEADKRVLEFHNGGRAIEPRKYANKITEAWFHMAKMMQKGLVHLPQDRTLGQQLESRQYHLNNKGQLIAESKDDYMKRGFESPDRADAAVMAFYDGIRATGRSTSAEASGRAVGMQ